MMSSYPDRRKFKIAGAVSLLGWSLCAFGDNNVAVLDFELHDLSLLPGSARELRRVSRVAPLLRDVLLTKGDYAITTVDRGAQQSANAGAGYLFTHGDSAADLGRQWGADWVLVGQLQKSNDLFAYLTVQLVNVHTQRRVGEFCSEIKGPIGNDRLTQRGVERLADQIDTAIKKLSGL